MDTNILDPNDFTSASADNSGIKNTKGVFDDINAPTPVFKNSPTPEAEPDNEHEDSGDGDDDED